MKREKLLEKVAEKEDKYFDLVWWSRIKPEDDTIDGVKENKVRIETLYQIEVKQLMSADSDWYYGFNSGMLAAMRWLQTLSIEGFEEAEDEFPFLDT